MFVKRYKKCDQHTSLRSHRHPFYVKGLGKIRFFLGPCSSFMRILINVEKSVIIVLQSLVLRRCKLIQTVRPYPPISNFWDFLKKWGIAAFSEITAKKEPSLQTGETPVLWVQWKKKNISFNNTQKYCQDGGFKLKQMSWDCWRRKTSSRSQKVSPSSKCQ